MRMIEFFSGIGGMRIAVENALERQRRRRRLRRMDVQIDEEGHHDDDVEVHYRLSSCQAYDISLHANKVYDYNFHNQSAAQNRCGCTSRSNVSTKLVEQLKESDLNGVADIWTMSPPCQPFTTTRGSKSLDLDDKRCAGLKGIMKILTEIEHKPRWIFLENVQGFRTSRMIEEWKSCLRANGYSWKSYLLSPIQLGIPNHRLRFYMLCERSDRWNVDDGTSAVHHTSFPPKSPRRAVESSSPKTVSSFLQEATKIDDISQYLVPESVLGKPFARDLGVVSGQDVKTHCFTAGYGRVYHRSTGSVLLMDKAIGVPCSLSPEEETGIIAAVADEPIDRSDMLQYTGRLRKFTPEELLTLFGFPSHFHFPDDITLEHKYKLVGNSISVVVVTELVTELLFSMDGHSEESEEETKVVSVPSPNRKTMDVGGTMGHKLETIDGSLLDLYVYYRWKMIKNCTGRYTCRDHDTVSTLSPLKLIEKVGISPPDDGNDDELIFQEFELDIEGKDKVLCVPLDAEMTVGVITFVKESDSGGLNDLRYVHTLNTPSGFRRKLRDMGVIVSAGHIYMK